MTNTQREITVQVRTGTGKGAARRIRRSGLIPGVVYGQGGEHVCVQLDPFEFRKSLDPERKLNTFFKLTIAGEKTVTEAAIIADHQINALKDAVIHVDFLRVDPEQEIVTKIPVKMTGRSAGIVSGGKLQTFLRFVRIAAKPGDVPVALEVDITALEQNDTLRIKDVSAANVRILEPESQPLAFITPAKIKKAEDEDKDKK
ncbi:MAG: 50S ribosomal protein L25 [Nannocystaceae bacterium]